MLLAAIMQNVELGKQITLYDVFTTEEVYRIWKNGNAWWYIGWGASPATGSKMPNLQRNLLRKIIEQADSCIQLPKTNVHLRFGHETVVMPLICLLDINGFGMVTDNLNELTEKGWVNYRAFPMGSNIQLVLYRKSPTDRDPLFKILLNENEATLPLPAKQAPYYRWSDFRTIVGVTSVTITSRNSMPMKIKSFLLLLASCLLSLATLAQSARSFIERDYNFAAGNYALYPENDMPQLTPAPQGYTPFYISHYGRP